MGRTTEREELDRLLESAHGGRGGRVLLVGDPGIGTSTLLHWLVGRASERGFACRSVAASDLPVRSTARSFPEPDAAPALVAIDDAHAAASPAVLAALAGAPAGSHTLVVASARRGTCAADALGSWPALVTGPLSVEDSALLLEGIPDARPVESVRFHLAEVLGGNPLALLQVPRMLTAEQLSGRTPLPAHLPMPPALEAHWGAVIDTLPASARRAGLDVLISGSRMDLLTALRTDGEWDDDDLTVLADRGLVRLCAARAPQITTPVVGHVVAARSSAGAVRRRHLRAAELGIALGLEPRVVVHHLVNATTTADDAVAAALEAQAVRAESLDQLVVASEAWQSAALVSTSGPDRVGRGLRALRLVITHGLDYADTDALLDLLAGQQLEAECALWVEWLRTLQRSDADPTAALTAQWSTIRRARAAAPDTLRGLLWDAAMNAWSLGDAEAGLRAAREYLEVERTLPTGRSVEPPWTGPALLAAGLFQSGDVAGATPMRAAALRAAAEHDIEAEPFDRLLSIVFLDDLLLDTSAESADRLLTAQQRAQAHSAAVACIDGIRAWRCRASGAWPEAHRLLARGRPLAALTGATGAQLGMGALACELAALEGDAETLEREAPHLRADAERVGDRRRLATIDRALGLRSLAVGDLDEAAVALSAAADVEFLGRGLRDAIIPSRVDLVDVFLRIGDRPEAIARAEAVCAILAAMDDPLARAYALRVRALAEDDTDLLRAALEAHAEAHDPFEEARTRLLLGEHLRREHQRSSARLHLLHAARTFGTLGAAPWLERTRVELRAAGAEPGGHADLSALTPQEEAVARAVASGRSNREVANALFLSPRTVEYHLGNVYRKLGVRGRTALARCLTR